MRPAILLIGLILISNVVSVDDENDHVTFIDKERIQGFAYEHPVVLVHWFAAWCTFCKDFAPTWSTMSDIVVEGKNNFEIVKVELGDDKEWKERFQVRQFPDYGVFVNGKYYPYNGLRYAGDILHMAANRTEDGILKIVDFSSLLYLQKNGNSMIVGLFEEGSDEETMFKKHVLRERNALFVLPSPEVRDMVIKKFDLTMPTMYAMTSFDRNNIPFTGSMNNEEDVAAFIDDNTVPTVYPTQNPRYKDYFYNHGKEWMTILIDGKKAKYPSDLSNQFVDFCKANRNTICFYISNKEKNIYEFYTKNRHISFPALLTVHKSRGYYFKYFFPQVVNTATEDWSFYQQGCINHQIEPALRSEQLPKPSTDLVQKLVGSTFKELAINNKEDVVIQFYSSFCEHCTKMAKRFEKVANYFKDTDLKFYKFASSENEIDVDGIYASYFHSVLYIHKGEKIEVIEYPRSRKIWRTKAMIKWIASQNEKLNVANNADEGMEDEL